MNHALDDIDEMNDFGFEGEEEDDRVEGEESERDEKSAWDVISGLFEDDRYEEEEAGEEEEMPPSTTVSTVEKEIEREPPSPEVIEHVPVEIPPEVLLLPSF